MFEFDLSILFELLVLLYCTSATHIDLLSSVDDSGQLQYRYCFFFSLLYFSTSNSDNFKLKTGSVSARCRSDIPVMLWCRVRVISSENCIQQFFNSVEQFAFSPLWNCKSLSLKCRSDIFANFVCRLTKHRGIWTLYSHERNVCSWSSVSIQWTYFVRREVNWDSSIPAAQLLAWRRHFVVWIIIWRRLYFMCRRQRNRSSDWTVTGGWGVLLRLQGISYTSRVGYWQGKASGSQRFKIRMGTNWDRNQIWMANWKGDSLFTTTSSPSNEEKVG